MERVHYLSEQLIYCFKFVNILISAKIILFIIVAMTFCLACQATGHIRAAQRYMHRIPSNFIRNQVSRELIHRGIDALCQYPSNPSNSIRKLDRARGSYKMLIKEGLPFSSDYSSIFYSKRFGHLSSQFSGGGDVSNCRIDSRRSIHSTSSLRRRLRMFRDSIFNDEAVDNEEDIELVSHLTVKGSKIDEYWIKQMKRIDKPVARDLISQLTPENVLGYRKPTGEEIKAGTMLSQALEEKEGRVDKIILFRCGDFYETYGIDAVMLVAYCGLNPMGGKCKAGCPVKNVQATLDRLTEMGLSIAVYEEADDLNIGRGPSKKATIKNRFLSQVVTPAFSTYTYDRCLQADDIDFYPNRPVIGIFRSNNGYLLCEIHVDERNIIISERLTEESVQSLLAVSGCVEPIYLGNDIYLDKNLCFLQDFYVKKLSVSGLDRDAQAMCTPLLRLLSRDMQIDFSTFRYTTKDFSSRPRPVYKSTALQIGLIRNENVPSLIPHLLTKGSYAYAQRFLYNWILNPPSNDLCDHMQTLCRSLANLKVPLTKCHPILEGKVVSLLLEKQCNPSLFHEIYLTVKSVSAILQQGYELSEEASQLTNHAENSYVNVNMDEAKLSNHPYATFLPSLLAISASRSGLNLHIRELYSMCLMIMDHINQIVESSSFPGVADSSRLETGEFTVNEEIIRNKVKASASPAMAKYFLDLNSKASKLCEAVQREYPPHVAVAYDTIANQLFMKSAQDKKGSLASSDSSSGNVQFISLPDEKSKNGKGSRKTDRLTTENVNKAMYDYLHHVYIGPKLIAAELQELCSKLSGSLLKGIIHSCHIAVVLQSINSHVIASKQRGWSLPKVTSFPSQSTPKEELSTKKSRSMVSESSKDDSMRPMLQVRDLSPYWLDRNTAVRNDVDLDGIILLTAPNMSGKSTLMRSLLVVALLANCGLFAPCNSTSSIPRFDCFFLRTASYDVPSEDKSAFAVEMDDVRVVLRDMTDKSLVMMDEIGKGTSARDGATFSGALLEELSSKKVYTVFATHLHELFELPLSIPNIDYRCMGYAKDSSKGTVQWTYKLNAGRCVDSMALETARSYGIPTSIIERAIELGRMYDTKRKKNTLKLSINGTEAMDYAEHSDQGREIVDVPSRETVTKNWRYALSDIMPHLRRIDSEAILVESYEDSPAWLEGQSCVYVLLLRSMSQEGADSLYVGETESISQRIHQHRTSKKNKRNEISVAVATVQSKSAARATETLLIQSLKKNGYDVVQDSDSSHRLFGSATIPAVRADELS